MPMLHEPEMIQCPMHGRPGDSRCGKQISAFRLGQHCLNEQKRELSSSMRLCNHDPTDLVGEGGRANSGTRLGENVGSVAIIGPLQRSNADDLSALKEKRESSGALNAGRQALTFHLASVSGEANERIELALRAVLGGLDHYGHVQSRESAA